MRLTASRCDSFMMAGVKFQTVAALVVLSHVAAFLVFLPDQGATGPIRENCDPNITYFACHEHLKNATGNCPRYRLVLDCLDKICKCDRTAGSRMSSRIYRREVKKCEALQDGQCLHDEVEKCYGEVAHTQSYLNKTQCLHLNRVYPEMRQCFKNLTDTCNSTAANNLVRDQIYKIHSHQTTCLYVDFMDQWHHLGNEGE